MFDVWDAAFKMKNKFDCVLVSARELKATLVAEQQDRTIRHYEEVSKECKQSLRAKRTG